jgi:hypothetical protein
MYTVTLKELQAVLKVNTQSEQSGAVNVTSLKSTAQGDDFQKVKRRVSNDTSETTMKSTKSFSISTAVKQTPKTVPTRKLLRAPQN